MTGKGLLLLLPLLVISPKTEDEIPSGPSKNISTLQTKGFKFLAPSANPAQNKNTLGVNLAMKGGAPDFESVMKQRKKPEVIKGAGEPKNDADTKVGLPAKDDTKRPKPMVRDYFRPMMRPFVDPHYIFKGKYLYNPYMHFPILQSMLPEIKPEYRIEPEVKPENNALPPNENAGEKLNPVSRDEDGESAEIRPSEEKKPFEETSSPDKLNMDEPLSPILQSLDSSESEFEIPEIDLDTPKKIDDLPKENLNNTDEILKKEAENLKKIMEEVKNNKQDKVIKRTVIVLENFGCSKCNESKKLKRLSQAFQ